ncbi:MAG TPA: SagB/ThcOx family dehydrogenase [Thermodesulfovibrionales bacterium]|nr:SagB/ThcOx family dehydrogenase [Thermodesulfovibrionales bacterium]
MNRIFLLSVSLMLGVFLIAADAAFADDLRHIRLPKPQTSKGKPLMQVLAERTTSRSFSPEKLSEQELSNLLWAAFGINRPDTGKRTAPSAVNWQEIEIYVATADGLYLYDAKSNMLRQVLSEDIRALTGRQDFVKEVPVNLIYVADFSKMGNASKEDKILYSAADTGFIAENVYLYCASEGLGTVVRGSIDRQTLAKEMKLNENHNIILCQSVGYAKRMAMGEWSDMSSRP